MIRAGAGGVGQGAWAVATAWGVLLFVSACGNVEPTNAQPKGFATPEHHPVTAELIAEHASIQPGGQTRVGVYFELEEGWHIYAEDPGDAGIPTKVTWDPSHGVSFGPLQWPVPDEFVDPGEIHTRGYSGSLVLFSTLTVTSTWDKTPAVLPVGARVTWLACKEICIPGSATLELALPFGGPNPPVFSKHAQFFEHADTP